MSIRFFINTKLGEIMSRLNNDVGGAQRAITGTFVDIITVSFSFSIFLRQHLPHPFMIE
jgi:ATP-binding cassette subfamily B protein